MLRHDIEFLSLKYNIVSTIFPTPAMSEILSLSDFFRILTLLSGPEEIEQFLEYSEKYFLLKSFIEILHS